jgi:tetratricopeptide (TPR) repeat protein
MLRAGDATGGIRDLKAFVDANPGNRSARQRIGAAVAERARELEDQGSREQALNLYEQATALRGDGTPPWAARVPPLRRAVSQDYFDKGSRVYRTNVAQAITFFETSLRYDPANTQAAIKLQDAKAAREKLEKIDKDARKP